MSNRCSRRCARPPPFRSCKAIVPIMSDSAHCERIKRDKKAVMLSINGTFRFMKTFNFGCPGRLRSLRA
ncbi:hypothetical protein X963_5716 [Burkholderia pseudomallei MSHR7498]|nr:hypothetical protein X962_5856 [Burkholderia pseudomallei MSHR7343]KGS91831.1 hypothetical protein X963_5716 [Burkholderia pseudomallei MSHR7498]